MNRSSTQEVHQAMLRAQQVPLALRYNEAIASGARLSDLAAVVCDLKSPLIHGDILDAREREQWERRADEVGTMAILMPVDKVAQAVRSLGREFEDMALQIEQRPPEGLLRCVSVVGRSVGTCVFRAVLMTRGGEA